MKYPSLFCTLLAFVIFILSCQTFPQILSPADKIHFTHLTKEEGLSDSFDWCILRDSKGFMWIGTSDGLDRYDGQSFKIFKYSPENISSLGANSLKLGGIYYLVKPHTSPGTFMVPKSGTPKKFLTSPPPLL